MLGDEWTRQDFEQLLMDGGPDIVSPNAHYDYEALLPAAADARPLLLRRRTRAHGQSCLRQRRQIAATSRWVVTRVSASPTCSSGSRQPTGPSCSPSGDNQWLAHTTYGYGDDEIVAYSERLAALFASNVSAPLIGGAGAPATLGEAMAARQAGVSRHDVHAHAVRREDPAVVDLLRPADVRDRWRFSSRRGAATGSVSFASTLEAPAPEQTIATAPAPVAVDVRLNRTTGNSALNAPVIGGDGSLTVTGNLNLVDDRRRQLLRGRSKRGHRAAPTGAAAREHSDP